MKIRETGGKAYFLHQMREEVFPVPEFIVINHSKLKALFTPEGSEGLFGKIKALIERSGNILQIAEQVRELVLKAPMDELVFQEILNHSRSLFGVGFRVAVRSSALDEDGTTHSFAGQHKTLLFIDEAGLEKAIRECLASAWSHSALSYRETSGLDHSEIQFALVIQEMVDAQRSGVAFSMDVTGNLADAVISCGYGLGEGIVNGQVETDTYLVNRVNQLQKQFIVSKTTQVKWHDGVADILPVAHELRRKYILAEAEVLRIYDYLMKAERMLGRPVDMEFSFDESSSLKILQVRPVTTIDPDKLAILDNTNIVESYPGITLPLSFSFAARAYETIFRNCAGLFRVDAGDLESRGVFENLISHFRGRVYYRLDHWYRMTARVYNSRSALKAWEEAVGLPDSRAEEQRFRRIDQLKMAIRVAFLILNYRRNNRRFFRQFSEEYQQFKSYRNYRRSPTELWDFFTARVERSLSIWPYTIINDFLAFKSFGWLQSLIRKWNIADDPDLANGLVSGYGEVWSEQALRSILDLKEMIRSTPALKELFEQKSEEIHDRLYKESIKGHEDLTDLRAGLDAYLEQYGDRTLAELKLETISPAMQPILLIDLLQSQLNSALTREEVEQKQRQGKEKAWISVKLRIPAWHPRYHLLKFVARLAAYGVMCRENMRFCRARMFASAREVFLALGDMMLRAELLNDRRDIFYLKYHEVQAFGAGKKVDCRAIVDRRKKEYLEYKAENLPDRIIYDARYEPVIRYEQSSRGDSYNKQVMQGTPVSRGVVEGEALVITEPVLTADVRGKILVTRMTDPGWVFLMSQAKGLVAEKGSILSHTAIVGRELGLPVIVGVQDVTSKIKTGDRLIIDGSKGSLEIIRASTKDQ